MLKHPCLSLRQRLAQALAGARPLFEHDIRLSRHWLPACLAPVWPCSHCEVPAEFREAFPGHRQAEIEAALQGGKAWVLQDQRSDGSWYASWGVCFTYGAWFGYASWQWKMPCVVALMYIDQVMTRAAFRPDPCLWGTAQQTAMQNCSSSKSAWRLISLAHVLFGVAAARTMGQIWSLRLVSRTGPRSLWCQGIPQAPALRHVYHTDLRMWYGRCEA